MISGASRQIDVGECLQPIIPTPPPGIENLVDKSDSVELSPKLRADLLDFDAWGEILTTYGRTMRVAVALTDPEGRVLGKCHNAQPVWTLVQEAATHQRYRMSFLLNDTSALCCGCRGTANRRDGDST